MPQDPIRERLGRHRQRLTAEEQGIFEPSGKAKTFHDLLLIGPTTPAEELIRVPVVKTQGALDPQGNPEPPGSYVDRPEKWDAYDYAFRRNMSIARPQDWSTLQPDTQRGPAFGTLPVKREPASTACVACYLVNAQNFTHRNAWTAEEWNDIGADDLPPAPSVDDDSLEVMLAGPRGMVFYVKIDLTAQAGWSLNQTISLPAGRGSIECIDLRHESELWNQLRNGLVAGRVISVRKAKRDGKSVDQVKPVAVLNVTSLVEDTLTGQFGPSNAEGKE